MTWDLEQAGAGLAEVCHVFGQQRRLGGYLSLCLTSTGRAILRGLK